MVDKLGGDATWLWIKEQAIKAKDYGTVADLMRYWTDRAKGKPPQAVKLEVEDGVQFSIGTIAEEAMAETNVGGGNAAN